VTGDPEVDSIGGKRPSWCAAPSPCGTLDGESKTDATRKLWQSGPRLAAGSGTQVQDVNRLLKQFMQMQKMMKQMTKGGMKKMLQRFKGKMPPSGMPF
jgi:hypothetical protein